MPAEPIGCSDASPCAVTPGRYTLGDDRVVPGLQLTVPAGWASSEDDVGELNLIPPAPAAAADRLFIWQDMSAVKSTGPGHGTTVLKVGQSADALSDWTVHNPDLAIVDPPKPVVVGGVRMRRMTVAVSASAKDDDPACPSNPACADLFTNSHWGAQFYGIGSPELVTLDFGTIHSDDAPRTVIIALDAANPADLAVLTREAQPIIDGIKLPRS